MSLNPNFKSGGVNLIDYRSEGIAKDDFKILSSVNHRDLRTVGVAEKDNAEF
jgi:hypothetical protein